MSTKETARARSGGFTVELCSVLRDGAVESDSELSPPGLKVLKLGPAYVFLQGYIPLSVTWHLSRKVL